ncbi:hypothetical protein ACFW1A_25480 [Kitasatospora sp. NPDC058965]|uniref:hypothetical protein n=1 Tax=Kitasatospora sp. NPDC058965 TaxID=3346682 RepID=UPI0036C5F516
MTEYRRPDGTSPGRPDGPDDSLWIEPTPAAPEPSWGEEQALRAMLNRAVAGVQPVTDALPRLQRAVPARRAQRRRVRAGAAAVTLLCAVGLPTLNGLGAFQLSDGTTSTGPVPALSSTGSGTGSAQSPSREPAAPVPGPGQAQPGSTSSGSAGASSSPTAASALPSGSVPPSMLPSPTAVPDCGRGDLVDSGTTAVAPDPAGRVSGVINVLNGSGHPCVLIEAGDVYASSGTGSSIQVVAHVAGDPGSLIPNPVAISPLPRLMPAGSRYQLPWVWVPDQNCTAAAPSPRSTASPAASAAASPDPATTGGASPSSPPSSPSPSPLPTTTITLSHRPLYTGPSVGSYTVGNTCPVGKVYVDPPLVGQ